MLFLSGETAKPRRLQGAMVTEKEVKDVVGFIKKQAEQMDVAEEGDLAIDFETKATVGGSGGSGEAEDDMYDEAKQTVIDAGKASASLLQRRLRVGYARAARLLDILEENGIIGPGDGAKPRDVYVKADGSKDGPSLLGVTGINADTPEAENDEV
jgi:S-DNA-T family DNA segregation ATPase FtsK/SpoIIIE